MPYMVMPLTPTQNASLNIKSSVKVATGIYGAKAIPTKFIDWAIRNRPPRSKQTIIQPPALPTTLSNKNAQKLLTCNSIGFVAVPPKSNSTFIGGPAPKTKPIIFPNITLPPIIEISEPNTYIAQTLRTIPMLVSPPTDESQSFSFLFLAPPPAPVSSPDCSEGVFILMEPGDICPQSAHS